MYRSSLVSQLFENNVVNVSKTTFSNGSYSNNLVQIGLFSHWEYGSQDVNKPNSNLLSGLTGSCGYTVSCTGYDYSNLIITGDDEPPSLKINHRIQEAYELKIKPRYNTLENYTDMVEIVQHICDECKGCIVDLNPPTVKIIKEDPLPEYVDEVEEINLNNAKMKRLDNHFNEFYLELSNYLENLYPINDVNIVSDDIIYKVEEFIDEKFKEPDDGIISVKDEFLDYLRNIKINKSNNFDTYYYGVPHSWKTHISRFKYRFLGLEYKLIPNYYYNYIRKVDYNDGWKVTLKCYESDESSIDAYHDISSYISK